MVVVPKQDEPRPFIRCNSWKDSPHVKDAGWPVAHTQSTTIVKSGTVSGGMRRIQSIMMAAIRWPKWYEFIRPREDDPNWNKVVGQNDGVVTHLLGEAVMPAMARQIMLCAATAAVGPITKLVDLYCCGGGFSLGAAEAVLGLEHVDGVDLDIMVLRNYRHNIAKALPTAKVTGHEKRAPTSLAELRKLLGRKLGQGTHIHASPPCQAFVNGNRKEKVNLAPSFALMVAACKAGCTASFEEHRDAAKMALEWLEIQSQDDQALLYVYSVTARDYGSPTARDRCIVTTFPLVGEKRERVNEQGEWVVDPPHV